LALRCQAFVAGCQIGLCWMDEESCDARSSESGIVYVNDTFFRRYSITVPNLLNERPGVNFIRIEI
jgi:hypothetical protein